MKLIRRQRIWLATIILLNLALWLVPSDVVKQIARDRHTMLGRYSRQHFGWIVGVGLFSLVSLYVDWSTGERYKRRWFQVLATLLVLGPILGVFDYLLRAPDYGHYIRDSLAYHHPANGEYRRDFTDAPEAYRTYPGAPPGYGTVKCRLRTDGRGFRNQTDLDRYDVVVLGDSFAEGSNVSDEHVWPAQLAEKSGLSVYNLGMSGYDPLHYLASLKRYGLALKPRYVLCMLYEGNDFRSAKSDRKRARPSFSQRAKRYLKQSPLISAADDFLVRTFGRINSTGPVEGIELLDWLPLAIPDGPEAKHYAFAPKQLRDLYTSPREFSRDRHWLNTRSLLGDMNNLCAGARRRFVVVYAPTKAHVSLPVVAGRLPAEKVRTFTAYSYRRTLPEPRAFLTDLVGRADARESVVGEWCRREGIPFVSMTNALREAAVEGTQVYYTYDQHWTPDGHEVVARAVNRFLSEIAPAGGARMNASDATPLEHSLKLCSGPPPACACPCLPRCGAGMAHADRPWRPLKKKRHPVVRPLLENRECSKHVRAAHANRIRFNTTALSQLRNWVRDVRSLTVAALDRTNGTQRFGCDAALQRKVP